MNMQHILYHVFGFQLALRRIEFAGNWDFFGEYTDHFGEFSMFALYTCCAYYSRVILSTC